MQLVDTNIFIHFLVRPAGDIGRKEHDACAALVERVHLGDQEIATTEACRAEIFHVLTEKQQFRRPVEEAVSALRAITSQRGLRIQRHNLYSQALDILDRHRTLGFEDALLAAHALETGMEIVSYDRHFDRVPGLVRVEPTPVTS